MRHATSNAERETQIRERAEAAALLPKAADKRKSQKEREAAAKAANPAPAKAKKEKSRPVRYVMGKFTPAGIVILAVGDHNHIEAMSAGANKEAGMRVAFVVAEDAVPADLLAGAADLDEIRDGEDEEEEEVA